MMSYEIYKKKKHAKIISNVATSGHIFLENLKPRLWLVFQLTLTVRKMCTITALWYSTRPAEGSTELDHFYAQIVQIWDPSGICIFVVSTLIIAVGTVFISVFIFFFELGESRYTVIDDNHDI